MPETYTLDHYVLNKDKRAHWNDDHITGVLDAFDPSAHNWPPENWTIPFPPNWEALPPDDPMQMKCKEFIAQKQKVVQGMQHRLQATNTTVAIPSAQAATAQFLVPPPLQLSYPPYPITYPMVSFPGQQTMFLPQQPTSSPPIAMLNPTWAPDTKNSASNERLEKLLEICYQCDTLNPKKVTMEASLHLPIDCSAQFALQKIEEGMGINVTEHNIGHLPTFDGKRRWDVLVQLKTVVHMEKVLNELCNCMSHAQASKKLYIVNIKPVPKADNKCGKSRCSNTVNNAIQSNPTSEHGKHLHLSNAMLSLWAQQWTDNTPGIDLHNPPSHQWNLKHKRRATTPPQTPPKSNAATTLLAKKIKAEASPQVKVGLIVTPTKLQPENHETIVLSSDLVTPVCHTSIISLSSSPVPGPSRKDSALIFNLCSDSSADESNIDELE
ncbi:uncharacterized protein EI90DRAFT_3121038 [Cantharellus anzutake]|uniref:uncharacterized protein n=1 Tax=Cantharellus anzutake TaxID=1750568 RepID=UPI001905A466|nr:uncharacterized protein EI90DRAFT_3121038 [Cantharellus anzutake]KAF8334617.1 hypothetical protein EI90DRAFT_3121038 [Cantharellus anzutake]